MNLLLLEKGKGGTVTSHYFNFVAMTSGVMDKHEIFKGHCLVIDNAPIHKHAVIRQYIRSRGYSCVYLPLYSPKLNPIEQFWSNKIWDNICPKFNLFVSQISFYWWFNLIFFLSQNDFRKCPNSFQKR